MDEGRLRVESANADGNLRNGSAYCLRQYCESAGGARNGAEGGNVPEDGAGSGQRHNRPATVDREHRPGAAGRNYWIGGRLIRGRECC